MVNLVEPFWDMDPVEVPVRTSGKRASARNPYIACLGCSEFIEIDPKNPLAQEVEVLETKDHWHPECYSTYCEKELEDAIEGQKRAEVDDAVKRILEKGIVKH